MTLSSTTNRNDATGTSSTNTYTYGFKIFLNTDLIVTVRSPAGVETTLALTTDYTVTGVGVTAGGTIVLVNAAQAWLTAGNLTTGWHITIRRVVPLTQLLDIRNQGAQFQEVVEDELDKLTMEVQQNAETLSRAAVNPPTVASSVFNPTLPAGLAGQAGVTVITDPTGAFFVVGPSADQISSAQSSATAAAASATAAAGSATSAASSAAQAAASAASVLYQWGGTVGGSANAITLTPTPALPSYTQGQKLAFIATADNTGAVTVNVSGLGVKSVKSSDGDALIAGEILNNHLYLLTYDGTNFRIMEAIVTTTKGDLQGHGATEPIRVPVGTNGQALLADSTAAPGVAWGHQTPIVTDISDLTEDTSPAGGDFVMTDDVSAVGLKKVKLSNLVALSASVAVGSYTGDGNASRTIPHTLGRTPTIVQVWKLASGGGATVLMPTQSANAFRDDTSQDQGAVILNVTSTSFDVTTGGMNLNANAVTYRFSVVA